MGKVQSAWGKAFLEMATTDKPHQTTSNHESVPNAQRLASPQLKQLCKGYNMVYRLALFCLVTFGHFFSFQANLSDSSGAWMADVKDATKAACWGHVGAIDPEFSLAVFVAVAFVSSCVKRTCDLSSTLFSQSMGFATRI